MKLLIEAQSKRIGRIMIYLFWPESCKCLTTALATKGLKLTPDDIEAIYLESKLSAHAKANNQEVDDLTNKLSATAVKTRYATDRNTW